MEPASSKSTKQKPPSKTSPILDGKANLSKLEMFVGELREENQILRSKIDLDKNIIAQLKSTIKEKEDEISQLKVNIESKFCIFFILIRISLLFFTIPEKCASSYSFVPPAAVDDELTCSVCMQKLSTKQSKQRHMHRHDTKPRFRCDICGKSYFQSASLMTHKKKKHN